MGSAKAFRTFIRVLWPCGIAAAMLAPSGARAQLTGQQLVAQAVSQYGPQYQDLDAAVALFKKGDMEGARRALAAAKKKHAHLPPVDVMLAQLLFSVAQAPAAAAVLERATLDAAADPEASIMFADLALREGRLAVADAMFAKGRSLVEGYAENAFRKQHLNSSALAGLAAVAEARRDWPEAVTRLRAWAAADPKSGPAQLRLGQALFRAAKFGEAQAALEAAYKIDSRLARPQVSLALLYDQAGDRAEAKKRMEAAVTESPKDLAVRLAAARWALDAGQIEMAQATLIAAQKLDPEALDVKLLLGVLARHLKRPADAAVAFESALGNAPGHFGATNQLALVLSESSDTKNRILALGYAQLNAQVHNDPNQETAREAAVTLTWVLSQLGHEPDLARRLQSILSAGSISQESACLAAQMLARGGNSEAAARILSEALVRPTVFVGRKDAEALAAKLKDAGRKEPAGTKAP